MSQWSLKPPQQNVAPLTQLKQLSETYPNEQIRPSIRQLSKSFPYYRPIYGDGNCFYRAFAFLYLRETPLHHFSEIFKNVEMVCTNLPIQFERVTFRQVLMKAHETFLKPIAGVTDKVQKERELSRIFNSSWMFDTLMIAYFRSLNHRQIYLHKGDYREYFSHSLEHELEKVATFNQESEGIELESLPTIFNIKLVIFLVQTNVMKEIVYNQRGDNLQFTMFFRPGHYDLVYADEGRIGQFICKRETRENHSFIKSMGKTVGQLFAQRPKIEPQYQSMNQQVSEDPPRAFSNQKRNTASSQRKFTDPRISVSRQMQEEANIMPSAGLKVSQRNKVDELEFKHSKRNSGNSQGISKTQNLRQFSSSETARGNSFQSFSEGVSYCRPTHYYNVKNKIQQTDWDLGRFLVESLGVIIVMTIGYYLLSGYL